MTQKREIFDTGILCMGITSGGSRPGPGGPWPPSLFVQSH